MENISIGRNKTITVNDHKIILKLERELYTHLLLKLNLSLNFTGNRNTRKVMIGRVKPSGSLYWLFINLISIYRLLLC